MKNLKLLFIALLFTFSLATISAAKAAIKQDNKENTGSGSNRNKDNGDGPSSPINNQILFLILTGTAIGCKLIADKVKDLKHWQVKQSILSRLIPGENFIEH